MILEMNMWPITMKRIIIEGMKKLSKRFPVSEVSKEKTRSGFHPSLTHAFGCESRSRATILEP